MAFKNPAVKHRFGSWLGGVHWGMAVADGELFAGDMVYMQSGYSLFGPLPGNILLALEIGP